MATHPEGSVEWAKEQLNNGRRVGHKDSIASHSGHYLYVDGDGNIRNNHGTFCYRSTELFTWYRPEDGWQIVPE